MHGHMNVTVYLFQKWIWEISASSWFYCKKLSRCTVSWTSNSLQSVHRRLPLDTWHSVWTCAILTQPARHFVLIRWLSFCYKFCTGRNNSIVRTSRPCSSFSSSRTARKLSLRCVFVQHSTAERPDRCQQSRTWWNAPEYFEIMNSSHCISQSPPHPASSCMSFLYIFSSLDRTSNWTNVTYCYILHYPYCSVISVCRKEYTGLRRVTTFRSTTDRIYDGGAIIL